MRKIIRDRSRKIAKRQAGKASKKEREARAKAQARKQYKLLTRRQAAPRPDLSRVLETMERYKPVLPPLVPAFFLHPFPHESLALVIDINDWGLDISTHHLAQRVSGVPMIDIIPASLFETPER